MRRTHRPACYSAAVDDAELAFREHAARLEAFASLHLSEADTRVHLIDPILRLLGYVGIDDIRREVPVPVTKEFIDYELRIAGQPHALVEAKALRHPILEQHAAQCVQYASILGVKWCLITNGVSWVIYNAHARGPLPEKRVAEVRLDGGEQAAGAAWSVLRLFSRDALAQSAPLTRLLTERVVADELQRADSAAIVALRRAVKDRFGEQISAHTVMDAVRRVTSWSATSSAVESDSVVQDVAPRLRVVATRLTTTTDAGRVQLAHLVSAGLIPNGATLECRLYGITHTARVQDGRLEPNGTVYPTPSAAACALRGGKATNGWVVWRYKGALLAQLRARYAEGVATTPSSSAE